MSSDEEENFVNDGDHVSNDGENGGNVAQENGDNMAPQDGFGNGAHAG